MKIKFTAYQTMTVHRTIEVPDNSSPKDIEGEIADIVFNLNSWDWDESIQESSKNQEFDWNWEVLDDDSDTSKDDE
jgi:hypothetical protein